MAAGAHSCAVCSSSSNAHPALPAHRVDDREVDAAVAALQRTSGDTGLLAGALQRLANVAGCAACQRLRSRHTQHVLGSKGAVEAVAAALAAALQLEGSRGAAPAVQMAVHTLHMLCLGSIANSARLAEAGGVHLLRGALAQHGQQPGVQEQGCMVLAAAAGQAGSTAEQALQAYGDLAAAAQQHSQHARPGSKAVAQAAVWSLVQLTGSLIEAARDGGAAAGQLPLSQRLPGSEEAKALAHAWPLLSGQLLSVVLELLARCETKVGDPLAHHCLDYLGLLGCAPLLQQQPAPPGSPQQQLLQAAGRVALDAARAGGGGGGAGLQLQGAALRALHLLVAGCPAAVPSEAQLTSLLPWLMGVVRDANAAAAAVEGEAVDGAEAADGRAGLRQQHQAAARSVQVHAIGLAGQLLACLPEGLAALQAARSRQSFLLAPTLPAVQAAFRGIARAFAEQQAEPGGYGGSAAWPHACWAAAAPPVQHADAVAALQGAVLVLMCSSSEGVNARDAGGLSPAHVLAALGTPTSMAAFLGAAGAGNVNLLACTPAGATPLQLARAHWAGDAATTSQREQQAAAGVLQLLERATEQQLGAPSPLREAGGRLHTPTRAHEPPGRPASAPAGALADGGARERPASALTSALVARALSSGAMGSSGSSSSSSSSSSGANAIPSCAGAPPLCAPPAPADDKLGSNDPVVVVSPGDRRDRRSSAGSAVSAFSLAAQQLTPPGQDLDLPSRMRHLHLQQQPVPDTIGSLPPAGLLTPQPGGAAAVGMPPWGAPGLQHQVLATTPPASLPPPSPSSRGPPLRMGSGLAAAAAAAARSPGPGAEGGNLLMARYQQHQQQHSMPPTPGAVPPAPAGASALGRCESDSSTQSASSDQMPAAAPVGGCTSEGSLVAIQQVALEPGGPASSVKSGATAASGAAQQLEHSESHGSLDDIEVMKARSASFADALAEAEFIAAHVEAAAASATAAAAARAAGAGAAAGAPGGSEAGAAGAAEAPVLHRSSSTERMNELGPPSRHVWLGNLNTRLPRSLLKGVFEQYGPVEDVVTFPGRMYAFVNFRSADDAARAAHALHDVPVSDISGSRKLVFKFRHSRKALGKLQEAVAAGLVDANGLPSGASRSESFASDNVSEGQMRRELSLASFGTAAMGGEDCGALSQCGSQANLEQAGTMPGACADLDGGEGGAAAAAADGEGAAEGADGVGDEAAGAETDKPAEAGSVDAIDDTEVPEGRPSRHLWLGNIPLKPNKAAMEALFARFGPVESVRVFPGKTFAFVNYHQAAHAITAKAALDGQPAPSITGPKPLVIRFQKDTTGAPQASKAESVQQKATPVARSLSASLLLPGGAALLPGLLDGAATEAPHEPAVNLSNKLNPNNLHYDRELAARYKRMTKAEKEALWAQDRAMQQLMNNPTAALLGGPAAAMAARAAAAATGLYAGNQLLSPALQQQLAALNAAAAAPALTRAMSSGALGHLGLGAAGLGNPLAGAAGQLGGAAGALSTLQRASSLQGLLPHPLGPAGAAGMLGLHGLSGGLSPAALAAAAGLSGLPPSGLPGQLPCQTGGWPAADAAAALAALGLDGGGQAQQAALLQQLLAVQQAQQQAPPATPPRSAPGLNLHGVPPGGGSGFSPSGPASSAFAAAAHAGSAFNGNSGFGGSGGNGAFGSNSGNGFPPTTGGGPPPLPRGLSVPSSPGLGLSGGAGTPTGLLRQGSMHSAPGLGAPNHLSLSSVGSLPTAGSLGPPGSASRLSGSGFGNGQVPSFGAPSPSTPGAPGTPATLASIWAEAGANLEHTLMGRPSAGAGGGASSLAGSGSSGLTTAGSLGLPPLGAPTSSGLSAAAGSLTSNSGGTPSATAAAIAAAVADAFTSVTMHQQAVAAAAAAAGRPPQAPQLPTGLARAASGGLGGSLLPNGPSPGPAGTPSQDGLLGGLAGDWLKASAAGRQLPEQQSHQPGLTSVGSSQLQGMMPDLGLLSRQ